MLEIIPSILNVLGPILNRIIPDPQKQAELQLEMTKALLDKDSGILNAMKDVMVADTQQDDKFTKRARPSVVYWSMGMVTVIGIAGVFNHAGPVIAALQAVPSDLYNLMTVGIGAFGVSRGIEKGISALKK